MGGSPDENEKTIRGSGIQEWLVSKLGDTELHLPVLTKKGIEKASFAGPNTNLEKRIKNLNVNITRSLEGKEIPSEDLITHPKSRFDKLALHHDLQYSGAERDCGGNKKCVRDNKHKADLKLMKGNIRHTLDPTNLNPLDRATHLLSIPAFASKIVGKNIRMRSY